LIGASICYFQWLFVQAFVDWRFRCGQVMSPPEVCCKFWGSILLFLPSLGNLATFFKNKWKNEVEFSHYFISIWSGKVRTLDIYLGIENMCACVIRSFVRCHTQWDWEGYLHERVKGVNLDHKPYIVMSQRLKALISRIIISHSHCFIHIN
jgi:hypothetical protein